MAGGESKKGAGISAKEAERLGIAEQEWAALLEGFEELRMTWNASFLASFGRSA